MSVITLPHMRLLGREIYESFGGGKKKLHIKMLNMSKWENNAHQLIFR